MLLAGVAAAAALSFLLVAAATPAPSSTVTRVLDVKIQGEGRVQSSDHLIDCGSRCKAAYSPGRVVTLTAKPRRYFSFAGWSAGCVGDVSRCLVALDTATRVRAVFTRNEGFVNVTVGGSGAIVSEPGGLSCGPTAPETDDDGCQSGFGQGTTIKLTPVPAPGFAFAAWGRACRTALVGPCEVVPSSSTREVSATFRRIEPAAGPQLLAVRTRTGEITSAPAGIACSELCSAPFASGTLVTLNARFEVDWQIGCVGLSTSCTVAVDGLTGVLAGQGPVNDSLPFSGVSLTVNGPGRVVGRSISCSGTHGRRSGCSRDFQPGTTVVLRAIPNGRGARFDRWSSSYCKNRRALTCRVTVFSPTSVVALFRRR
jgi:hypothetical protein